MATFFLDIELNAITGALRRLDAQCDIMNWLSKLLCQRISNPTLGDSKIIGKAGRATSKVGVLSPLLWNLVMSK